MNARSRPSSFRRCRREAARPVAPRTGAAHPRPCLRAAGLEIEARLRFRIGSDGSLSFAYILNRPHLVIKEAFDLTRTQIQDATKTEVHLGTAEIVKA